MKRLSRSASLLTFLPKQESKAPGREQRRKHQISILQNRKRMIAQTLFHFVKSWKCLHFQAGRVGIGPYKIGCCMLLNSNLADQRNDTGRKSWVSRFEIVCIENFKTTKLPLAVWWSWSFISVFYCSQLCQMFCTSSSSSMMSMSFSIRNLRFRGDNARIMVKTQLFYFAERLLLSTNVVILSQHLA
jgi:hypothetical protein